MWLPTIVATPRYDREVERLLSRDDQDAMELAIAMNPESHPVIPGLNGVRKARWSRPGMGKRGGLRIVYYCVRSDGEILLLTIYPKNQKENLTDDDKKEIRRALSVNEEARS